MFSKFALVAAATTIFAGLASATPVTANCTPAPLAILGQSGSGIETCTVSISGAFTINTVFLTSFFDGLYDPKKTLGSIDFSQNIGGLTGLTQSATQAEGGAIITLGPTACLGTCLATVAAGINNAGFTVTDSFVSTPGGNASANVGASFNKTIILDYTAVTTGTPEPASFAMIGAGLLALGFAARRRRA